LKWQIRASAEEVLHERLAAFDEAIQGYNLMTARELLREVIAVTPELSVQQEPS